MPRIAKEPPLGEIARSHYQSLYVEELFQLHPDDELLARMWEMDAATMARLMPEIGNETSEEIDQEVSKPRSYLNFAINSLRVACGRELRLTPRQRMREARLQLDETPVYEDTTYSSFRQQQDEARTNDTETYFAVAWYVARQEVLAEQEDRRRRLLGA